MIVIILFQWLNSDYLKKIKDNGIDSLDLNLFHFIFISIS